MLAKVSTDVSSMINISEEAMSSVLEQAKYTSLNLIIRGINILTKVEVDSKWSSNSRVMLEIGLIKILQPDLESSIEALTERIEKLENRPVSVHQRTVQQDNQRVVQKESSVKDEIVKDEIVKVEEEVIIEAEKEYERVDSLSMDKGEQEDLWEDVLDRIKERKISAHALLLDGKFEGFIDNCICISYGEGYGFHMIAVDKKDNREIVESAIASVYGAQIRVKYISYI